MTFDERLKAAVTASAAPVPEDFLHTTRQMIDHLPRKERIIVRNKLSYGLVLAIILCMLTLTAVAAVLLTGKELVETEVLPMAIGNDTSTVLHFTEEELQFIEDLAAKNGAPLSENALQTLRNGLRLLENNTLQKMAPNVFSPDPMCWSYEEQYWLHEAMVQLGKLDRNDRLIPGEGDLTEAEAIAFAMEHLARQPEDDKAYLSDPDKYTLTRSFQKGFNVKGDPLEKVWLIGFMEKDGPSWYQALMDEQGGYIAVFWHDTTEIGGVKEEFTHEELAQIVALAEENGIQLSDRILRALNEGEGYWEEEVIMSLAKAQFGPYPGQWTIEQQYWFDEMMIAIGFVDENDNSLPDEGDMTYDEAYAKAVQHLQAEGWVPDPALLDDRTQYALTRTFSVWEEYGSEPMWYFYFEPLHIELPTLSVIMYRNGEVESIGRMPGLSERLAEGMPAISVIDVFRDIYGVSNWTPEVYIAYVDALRQSDLTRGSSAVQCYLATEYILPPEGALTAEEAVALAAEHVSSDFLSAETVCFRLDGRAVWKVVFDYDGTRSSHMVELDALTGEILDVYEAEMPGHSVQYHVPRKVYQSPARATPAPGGLG